VVALFFLAIHLLPHPGYGFHRDELLYLAMGDHLDLFRMQFPPQIAILARAAHAPPLDLLASVRLLAALAGTTLTVLAALICRELGGGPRSQTFAAVAVLFSPLFLRAGTLFQPVVFEQVWWSVAMLAMAKLLAGRDRRWWLVVGTALGLSAMLKFSAAFLGLGLFVATLGSPLRNDLRTRWPWLAAAVAALLAAPGLVGQVVNGWPFLVQIQALRASQFVHVDRLQFVTGQFFMLGPGAALWLVGLGALLAAPRLRPYRALGLLAAAIFLVFMWTGGKPYYFGPVHILLIAAAAAFLGMRLRSQHARTLVAGAIALYCLVGLALLPIGIPLLPPEAMARYAQAIGITQATETNRGTFLPLPQDFADMTGWKELVDSVAAVYRALPEPERTSTTIFGINYGRTGALAVYGPALGLPYPVSRYGDFFAWGWGNLGAGTTIVVGGSREGLDAIFDEVEEAAVVRNRWGVDEEQEVPIWVCRRPRVDLKALVQREGVVWG
jgi:hypothetical protein